MSKRGHGEGSYETQNGKVRHVRRVNGRRLKGPWSPSRQSALNSWLSKFSPRASAPASELADLPLNGLPSKLFAEDETATPIHPITRRLAARWSETTLDSWRRHITAICAALGSASLSRLSAGALTDYLLTKSPRTARNYYADLRLLAREIGLDLPPIRLAQVQQRAYPILMPGDVPEALESAGRHWYLVALLYYSGLRLSEACGLKKSDWNPATGELAIRRAARDVKGATRVREGTKTGRLRYVPIASERVRAWIESRPQGYLLGDTPDAPLSACAARQRILHVFRGTKFEGMGPQNLRRSTATAYCVAGVPISVAESVMGHSSKMLKEVYAQFQPESRMAAAKQAFS